MLDRLQCRGRYFVEHRRKGRVVSREDVTNLIVNQGLDHILATEFTGGQQVTQWYLGLFKGNYTPVATDTAATFPGSATESADYSGGVRQPFAAVEGNQQVTNAASQATFTFTASVTIYGGFLISSQQQGSVQGTLFSATQFASPKNVVSGDQLVLTYGFAAATA